MKRRIEVTLTIAIDEHTMTVTAEARDAHDDELIAASRVVADPDADMEACAVTTCANVASSLAQRACLPDVDDDDRQALLEAAHAAMSKIRH